MGKTFLALPLTLAEVTCVSEMDIASLSRATQCVPTRHSKCPAVYWLLIPALIRSRPFTPGYTGFVPAANESVELRRYPRSAAPPETSTAGTHR